MMSWCWDLVLLLIVLLLSDVGSQSCPASEDLNGQGQAFRQPCEWRSDGGRLRRTLKLGVFSYSNLATVSFQTRAFDGRLPGPTLRLKPGDSLELTLQNDLEWGSSSKYSKDCETEDCLHNQFRDPDVTNLHVHGLHVSPESPGDDVLVSVNPKSSHAYRIQIPDDHSPGTYWYHPHHHGSTSLQVGGGAAGAIVIEDREGDLPPSVANLEERILVFQEFPLSATSSPDQLSLRQIAARSDDHLLPRSDDPSTAAFHSFTLVNGLYRPVIEMETGRWYRFRMIWASLAQTFWVRFGGCEVRLLAIDGVYLSDAPNREAPTDETSGGQKAIRFLSGSRVDALVRCPSAPPRIEDAFSHADDLWIPGSRPSLPELLFRMRMTRCTQAGGCGAALPPSLPVALNRPPYLQDLQRETNVAPQFRVRFQGPPCSIATDALDPHFYDPNTPIHSFVKGQQVQEWRIEGLRFHPVHLHVMHVQIQETKHGDGSFWNDTMYRPGDWVDTIALPSSFLALPEITEEDRATHAVVRFRPYRYPGNWILHCHTLTHEDQGCMTWVDVKDEPGSGPPPLSSSPVCGNGVREDGEECDSEPDCLADTCRWGTAVVSRGIRSCDQVGRLEGVKKVVGSLGLQQCAAGASLSALSDLEIVTGSIELGRRSGNGTELSAVSFPNLRTVGSHFAVNRNTRLTSLLLPQLRTVGGDLDLNFNQLLRFVDLGHLGSVGRQMTVVRTGLLTLSLGSLASVTSHFRVGQNGLLGTLSAPQLSRVGGRFQVEGRDLRHLTVNPQIEVGGAVWVTMRGDTRSRVGVRHLRPGVISV